MIFSFFVPSTDVILSSNSNAGYFLNDVIFGSFVKFQRLHRVIINIIMFNAIMEILLIYQKNNNNNNVI